MTSGLRIKKVSDLNKGSAGIDGRHGLNGKVGPRGPAGPASRDGHNGSDGDGFEWKGNYKPDNSYEPNDVVHYNGSSYICVKHSKGKPPSGAREYWELMAEAGSHGGGGGPSLTSAAYNEVHELILTNSDGSTVNAGVDRTSQIKTYQFELDNFKKGNTAPSTEYVGTAPRVTTFKFDNLLQRVGFTFMVPLDWDGETDMQFMAMTAVPAGVTHNVGDIINLKVESRVTRHNGITKLDDAGQANTTQTTSTSSPYYEVDNYNTMLAGGNTEYHTYMPSVVIPVADIGGVGAVMYAEVGLNSISTGSVPSILIYQLHLNYFGIPQ